MDRHWSTGRRPSVGGGPGAVGGAAGGAVGRGVVWAGKGVIGRVIGNWAAGRRQTGAGAGFIWPAAIEKESR
jgi:hypothetical protein